MKFWQLLSPERTSKFVSFCNFFGVTLILFQCRNPVNSSRSQDLNLTNGDYVSEILRRSKRHAMSCEIPNYGVHTKYTILGETTITYQPGDYAQQYYTLEISCDRGYNLKPYSDKRSVCINGQWNPPLTINCIPTCPSLKSTMSTSVKCKYRNLPLENCNDPIAETTALLSCNPLYEQDNLQKNRIRLCKAGRWIPSISECYPICGIKRPEGTTNIINGQIATLGDYPWQIGIYNAQKEYICGGSIIDRHIILTAAHCLTDHNGNVKPTEDYLIAAGKYFRKYNDDKDEFAQYSKIQHIYVPERYTGILNNYALDIAIILLADPFTISLRVQPVCIELNEESPHLHLSLNTNGIVTGWGYTEEGRELSDVLKELVIPFVPFRKCFEEVPSRFKKYITTDKICGGYLNNKTSVCGGDSGGALVFQNPISERYYVKGIVSTSPATVELTCDSNQYSLYTSTSAKDNIDFITDILAYNQIVQSIEFTNEETDENGSDSHSCSSEYYISEMLNHTSSAPQIIPKVAEFTINASSTFELRCLSKNLVTWTFPNNLKDIFPNETLTKYSTITIQSSKCGSVYESRLTIGNASFLDVGFYYCHEKTTEVIKSPSIYIYVKDDQKLFLMPEFHTRTVTESSTVILPCRPTSPDVHVKLLLNTAYEVPLHSKDHNYITYDSKLGFTYTADTEVNIYKSYQYSCKFSIGPYEQSASFNLFIEKIPYPPRIKQISNDHLAVGQKLELLCISHYPGSLLPLKWIIPDFGAISSNRVNITNMQVFARMGVGMENRLIIEHAKIEDQGNYTCITSNTNNVTNNSTIFIKIYDETV